MLSVWLKMNYLKENFYGGNCSKCRNCGYPQAAWMYYQNRPKCKHFQYHPLSTHLYYSI